MFIVAIDGPAGTGKGTITKIVAEKLGLVTIDTGATYRCITLAMIKKNVKLEEEEKIKEILEKSKIEFKSINGEQHTFLNDEDVSKEIRSNEVNSMVSQVSALKFVRYKMVDLQRKLAEGKDVIMEGRDIGTYVFPNADVKIYLDAEPEERARRRQKQNEEAGIQSTYEDVLAGIIARDENDKNKEMGALKIAEDAVVVDGTYGTIEENVQKVIDIINKKKQKNNKIKNVEVDASVDQKKDKNDNIKNVGVDASVDPKKTKQEKTIEKLKVTKKEPLSKIIQREIVRSILWVLYKIVFRVKVIGKENVPKDEPFILCGNHVEFIKVPIIELFTTGRKKVYFMAKIELLNNPFLRWFAYLFNVIPVKRGKQDMYAMKQSLQALSQGDALGIFPEGTTNGIAKKVKVKTGTAYMALRTGTKVLPVGIKTTKTNRVIVNIGKTLNYNEQKEKNPDKEKLEETTKEIMDTIIMLTETAK